MERTDIEALKIARRHRVAEEIADALKNSGLSKKEFAGAMNRQPSEVTKWLSGTHNFTCDLLEELSIVLGTSISGTKDPVHSIPSNTVDGYSNGGSPVSESLVCEPSGCELIIDMPLETMEKLKANAAIGAMTLREYVKKILLDKLEEKHVSVMDLCGSCPDFPLAEELQAERTNNTFPEL